MTFSGIDSVVLLLSAILLGSSISTAAILLRRAVEKRQGEKEAITAVARLHSWRRSGLLVMTDEDFGLALELGEYDPDQLDHLAKTIDRIIDEKEIEPGDELRLTVRFEYEGKSEDRTRIQQPKGHLELIAAFS